MKRIFKTLLILTLAVAIAVSSSGCITTAQILNIERCARRRPIIQNMLCEKYGEEFVIHKVRHEGSGGGGNGVPNFKGLFDFSDNGTYYATCSPKANEEILFETSIRADNTKFYDEYPHAVVKYLIKEELDRVLSKYTDNYVIDITMYPPSTYISEDIKFLETYDPFTRASDITIQSYSEKFLERSQASIDIIIEGHEHANADALQKLFDNDLKDSFHKMPLLFEFRFTSKEKVDQIKKELSEKNDYSTTILSGEYPIIHFRYDESTDYKFWYNEKQSIYSKPRGRYYFVQCKYVYDIKKEDQEQLLYILDINIPESEADAFVYSFGYTQYTEKDQYTDFVIEIEDVNDYKNFFEYNELRVVKYGEDGKSQNEKIGEYNSEYDKKYGTSHYITYKVKLLDYGDEAKRSKKLKEIFERIKEYSEEEGE